MIAAATVRSLRSGPWFTNRRITSTPIRGDTIYVYTEPQTFLAFGASGKQGQFKIDDWRISLAEAVAKAEGLNDAQADPAAIFLYRGEPREITERMGIDCSKFAGPVVPVIYGLNLRNPGGYFLAANFEMHNKDIIYTANALSVESTRFLNFLRTIMATADDRIVYATNYYTLLHTIDGSIAGVTVNKLPPYPAQ